MHVLRAADDGIDRACVDAFCAADAVGLNDQCDTRKPMWAARPIEWLYGNAEQSCQGAGACIAAGRASVDVRNARGDRFRIRAATGITTLPALGLRQDAVEAFDQVGHCEDTVIRVLEND
jgi:hypothetical protein